MVSGRKEGEAFLILRQDVSGEMAAVIKADFAVRRCAQRETGLHGRGQGGRGGRLVDSNT